MDKTTNGPGKGTCTLPGNRGTGQGTVGPLPANPLPLAARSNRASKEEFRLRVGYVVQMLLDGRRKHEIKQFFRTQFGLKSRQVERHLRLARARLVESNGVDVDQMRAEQHARFMQIYRQSKQDGVKLAALKAAGSLYGLDAPRKVAETTVADKDVDVLRETVKTMSVEELRVLRSLRNRMHSVANGESSGAN